MTHDDASDPDSTAEFLLQRRHSLARIQGQNFNMRAEVDLLQSGSWLTLARSAGGEEASQGPDSEGGEEGVLGMSALGMERALASARIIAVTEGLDAVALARVTSLADLSPEDREALLEAFPDGAALCVYLIQRFYAPLIKNLSLGAVDSGDGPLLDKLVHIAALWVENARQDLPFFLLINDAWRRPVVKPLAPEVQAAVHMVGNRWFSIVTSLIAECQLRGEVRPGSPEVFAHVTSAMFYGLMATISRPERLLETQVYVEDVVRQTLALYRIGFGTQR